MREHDRYVEIFVSELSKLITASINVTTTSNKDFLNSLARADHFVRPAVKLDNYVLSSCGIEADPTGVVSKAVLLASFDANTKLRAPIICCDPVFLKTDPSRLMLFDARSVGISEEEASLLVSLLNELFESEGLRIWYRDPTRWYLEGIKDATFEGTSPTNLVGVSLEPGVNSRKASAGLSRIMTEAQMVLHDCEVNRRRADEGKPPINSIWLWGGGHRPMVSRPRIATLFSVDAFSLSCANFCGLPSSDLEDMNLSFIPNGKPGLVVLSPGTVRQRLDALVKTVMPQAVAALKSKEITKIIINDEKNKFSLNLRMLKKFWRRKQSLITRIVFEEDK